MLSICIPWWHDFGSQFQVKVIEILLRCEADFQIGALITRKDALCSEASWEDIQDSSYLLL